MGRRHSVGSVLDELPVFSHGSCFCFCHHDLVYFLLIFYVESGRMGHLHIKNSNFLKSNALCGW